MVNWKAASYSAGIFSVLVFVITTVLFVMYLNKTPEGVNIRQKVADSLAPSAQVQQQEPNNNIKGGTLKRGTLAAIILELSALVFSIIIWGLTFGQAKA